MYISVCNVNTEEKSHIVFILDSSASIGEPARWKIKQFAVDVLLALPAVRENQLQVAVIDFSDTAKVVIPFESKLTNNLSRGSVCVSHHHHTAHGQMWPLWQTRLLAYGSSFADHPPGGST